MRTDRGDAGSSLADTFWATARQLRQVSQEALAHWQITPSQSRALSVLARHGAMRLGDLSDHLRIAARSGTEVVDALEERGLVERRADPNDRRATLVELTGPGNDLVHELRAHRGAGAEGAFAVLTRTEQAELRRLLTKVATGA